VDTVVTPLTQSGTVAGDGIINAAEAAAGVTIGGAVEAGAQSVTVTLSNGRVIQGTISGGTWSVALSASDLSEGNLTYTVRAVDAAGNVGVIGDNGSLNFTVDTVAPTSPELTNILRNSGSVSGVTVDVEANTDVTFHQVGPDGVAQDIPVTTSADDLFRFGTGGVSDGSYLVINSEDAAGNGSASLAIVNNTTAVTVDLGRDGLEQFDFSSIDLTFAPDAQLTLTADDLARLTGVDQELTIRGDSDDRVNLDNATNTGTTRVVDGERYDVYNLGDGTVLVDEDIQTTVI
jgi:hypothetical protein